MFGIWYHEHQKPSIYWISKYIHVIKNFEELEILIIKMNSFPTIFYYGGNCPKILEFITSNKEIIYFRIDINQEN